MDVFIMTYLEHTSFDKQKQDVREAYARRTRSFPVTKLRSSNSARINKFDFKTEKIV